MVYKFIHKLIYEGKLIILKPKWFIDRLKQMNMEEIILRSFLIVKKSRWSRRKSWVSPDPHIILKDNWRFPNDNSINSESSELLIEANNYGEGNYSFLNLQHHEDAINWHLDQQTGLIAPMAFGLDINYRNASLVGNVKNIWEKNRHHHLTVLALAYALTKNEQYAEEVKAQLSSWVEANPFPMGINWNSSLELGIRLISWVWVERLLRGSQAHQTIFGETGYLWPSIYWHQWMISQNYSHGSSANNHLVGEMAGLYCAAVAWPYFKKSLRWQKKARAILEKEVIKQTYPGGLNREQAFSYHLFSLEFFLLACLEAERVNEPFSHDYKTTLRTMIEVISFLKDSGGNLPNYGDGDEGMALQLRPLSSDRIAWLTQLGAVLFGPPGAEPAKAGALQAEVLWPEKRLISDLEPPAISVEDAGLFILTSGKGSADEVFLLVDVAPLGYLSIAAHGHADALSFTLSIGGVPIIIDPGTYTYHYDLEKRDYFKSTKAHNTITLDDQSQSVSGGPFMWTKKAIAELIEYVPTSEGGKVTGKHLGYRRLKGRVIHQREVELVDKAITLCDSLLGEGSHFADLRLHFAPWCRVDLEAGSCKATWEKGEIVIGLDRKLNWKLLKGEKEGGWYSRGFNLIEPTTTLTGTATTAVPVQIITAIKVKHY